MDELPELPFEQVLSYLSLEDVIKARAVSRRWRDTINSFKVKSLCYSSRPSGFIFGKSRWVSGAFAQNFISSTRSIPFLKTFGRSILFNLKRLRLCDIVLKKNQRPAFAEILQSFGRLEQLEMIFSGFSGHYASLKEFKLRLPMLKSIHVEGFNGFDWLTLDAPRLQKVRIDFSMTRMDLIHVESVERVTIYQFGQMAVKQLKNLKQLYVTSSSSSIDPTLLSGLEQLREIHLTCRSHVPVIFEQKRRYGLADLKVYVFGLLLNGPDDREINAGFYNLDKPLFVHWAENQSRLADEIPFYKQLHYSAIERVAPEVMINVMKRLTDFDTVLVDEPIRDTERFLDFLKSFHITKLRFWCVQPQDLFDRLPEHCAVQRLTICSLPSDHQFLFRLKYLSYLNTDSLDIESVRRIFDELEFFSAFLFNYRGKMVIIRNLHYNATNNFNVSIEGKLKSFPNLNAAIQFLEST